MAGTYKVELDGNGKETTLKIGFGAPAQNNQIVKDAVEGVRALCLKGGEVVRLNGPASLPVAIAIAHEVGHLFGVVAAFDPKMGKYVVAVSHDPKYALGDLID